MTINNFNDHKKFSLFRHLKPLYLFFDIDSHISYSSPQKIRMRIFFLFSKLRFNSFSLITSVSCIKSTYICVRLQTGNSAIMWNNLLLHIFILQYSIRSAITKANNMVHIWPMYRNGLGCCMVEVWFSFWFGMGYCHPYKSHSNSIQIFSPFYGNATYFVKFHIYLIGYDMVMVWFGPIAIPCNFSALSMGMLCIL